LSKSPTNARSRKRILLLLERLTDADGVSGDEDRVREVMERELRPVSDRLTVDSIGNLIAEAGPDGSPRVALFAHMDEVGLLVKHIRPDGYLAFEISGGIDSSILPSQWVRISTAKGVVKGVIGSAPGHLVGEGSEQRPDYRMMYIDIGVRSSKEALSTGVRVGDAVAYDRHLSASANGEFAFGKALDNRIGCLVMIEVFKACVASPRLSCRLLGVGTTMEETGALGARAAARALSPDVAIILDGIPAHDPLVPREISAGEVGRGPIISKVEGRNPNANAVPRWLFESAVQIAEKEGIPYQVDVNYFFDSDAGGINFSMPGTPIIPVYVPRQNSHSPAEIASLQDIENAIRLTTLLVRKLGSNEKLKKAG